MFKTFKAKIHGTVAITTGNNPPVDTTVKFSKTRIILNEEQTLALVVNSVEQDKLIYYPTYEFDKRPNKEDKKMFSVTLINGGIRRTMFLDIDWKNKIKANVIHHRYWVDRQRDWFVKAFIGLLLGLIATYIGHKMGI